jgi:8-oxo-dGTP diphosphatase
MPEHFLGKVALKAFIEREGKILIVRDVNDDDVWEIPGGRLDEGEAPEAGLARELREELGVEIEVGELIYTEQSLHTQKGEWTLFLVFRASIKGNNPFVLQADEIAEAKWVDQPHLNDQKIYPVYLKSIEAHFKKQT